MGVNLFFLRKERIGTFVKTGIHMPLAGTLAYQLLARASYRHIVNALTGMPVSGKQVDRTRIDLLAYNTREGTRLVVKPARGNRRTRYLQACQ